MELNRMGGGGAGRDRMGRFEIGWDGVRWGGRYVAQGSRDVYLAIGGWFHIFRTAASALDRFSWVRGGEGGGFGAPTYMPSCPMLVMPLDQIK